jgi:hypothetical protein
MRQRPHEWHHKVRQMSPMDWTSDESGTITLFMVNSVGRTIYEETNDENIGDIKAT